MASKLWCLSSQILICPPQQIQCLPRTHRQKEIKTYTFCYVSSPSPVQAFLVKNSWDRLSFLKMWDNFQEPTDNIQELADNLLELVTLSNLTPICRNLRPCLWPTTIMFTTLTLTLTLTFHQDLSIKIPKVWYKGSFALLECLFLKDHENEQNEWLLLSATGLDLGQIVISTISKCQCHHHILVSLSIPSLLQSAWFNKDA